MSEVALFARDLFSKKSTMLLTAALLLFCMAGNAHATVLVNPPAGWPGGEVTVGREINGKMWAVYWGNAGGSSGACHPVQIGVNNALYNNGERVHVRGGDAQDDVMLVVGGLVTSRSACGKVLIQFSTQPKVGLYGRGGNDWIQYGMHNPNGYIDGGSGDDSIISGQGMIARGGPGADWIIGAYPGWLYGDGDGDVLCSLAETQQAAVTLGDCGAWNTDQIWGRFVDDADCENETTQEECQGLFDAIRAEIGD